MAQAVQITTTLPSGEYVVIDNAAAGNFTGNGGTRGTSTAGAPGYDTTWGATLPGTGGTLSQATNPYTNGTIPGFVASATLTTAAVVFKNPATY